MPHTIAVVGTGYVGLVAAVGLADFGNFVVGVDIDERKVESLNRGCPTIFEHDLEEYLQRNIAAGRLSFSSDFKAAVASSDMIFLTVGTPVQQNGETDLTQVQGAIELIAPNLTGFKVIVTKSTVPVGTNRWIQKRLREICGHDNFGVLSNPEFLREGKAVFDFFHPDRVVVGFDDEKSRGYAEVAYRPLHQTQTPFVWCSFETAELIKLSSNAFLATKISFINQIANLSEAVGADIQVIARAMGMDGRIGSKFLHPGPGFGGSCFPKDLRALASIGDKAGIDLSLIKEVTKTNEVQKERTVVKLKKLMRLRGKVVTVLGLAFKSETDDVRESPALAVVDGLLKEGAVVKGHDPKAIENFRRTFPNVSYHQNLYDASSGADAVIILTEWNEYRSIDMQRLKSAMKGRIVIDARNVLESKTVKDLGFDYQGTGR